MGVLASKITRKIELHPENRLGRPVITSQNAAQLNHVVTQMIDASASVADDPKDINTDE